MVSNDSNISNLVKILKENDIRDIVISPGGTNIKFVKAVQDDPFFKCYSVVDERSAIYFAIGLYLQKGKIIATSCTSAQATRNYIPGLTEAFYKKVPILAITMSKHPRFTYQEYMQAPDQASLPKDCVKKSYSVPYISDENDMLHSIRVINEAILELTHNGKGPVQLCIPELDFPLTKVNTKMKIISRYNLRNLQERTEDISDYLLNKKIMIVIGEHRPFEKKEREAIEKFAESYNCFIYVNHLSNFKSQYTLNANLTLLGMQENEFKNYSPDILISIGGQTGDYPFYKMLSKLEFSNIEHWRINIDGAVTDTYDKLTKIFEMEEQDFFNALYIKNSKSNHSYYESWKSIVLKQKNNLELPLSNGAIAQILSKKITKKSVIQFSILNSLRMWSLFELSENVECYSNVGAFGIDGGMSTLIGQSMATDKDCYMIIGDLAFLYDINSISIKGIKNNLKILLVNNNGGVEFKLYSKPNENKKIDQYTAAGGHFKNAKGWAETCGFEYLSANSMNEFLEKADRFVSKSNMPMIFEVFVEDIDEAKAYNILLTNNYSYTMADLKEKTKDVIKSKLKNIVKK